MISSHKYVPMLMVMEYGLVEVDTYQNTAKAHPARRCRDATLEDEASHTSALYRCRTRSNAQYVPNLGPNTCERDAFVQPFQGPSYS